MINAPEFLKLLSLCVKEIKMFSPRELCKLVHLTTVDLGWRDQTLLRLLEPHLLTSFSSLDISDVICLIEAYSKLRCGSRAVWESMISCLISYIHSTDLSSNSDIFRIIRCILHDEAKFYKPLLVLEKMAPLVDQLLSSNNPLSISECADLICVYSRWPKAIGTRSDLVAHFEKCLQHIRESSDSAKEFQSCVRILSCVQKQPTPQVLVFVKNLQTRFLSDFDHINIAPSDLVELVHSFSKLASSNDPQQRSLFMEIHNRLVPVVYQISPSKLPLVAQIFGKLFGLVNTYKFNPENFGPIDNQAIPLILAKIGDRCVKEGTMTRMSVRGIARLGEAMANVRLNNIEFWASFATVLAHNDPSNFSELSPEELGQFAFTIAEMNLTVSDHVRNSLVMLIFEKIHLMDKFYNQILMFFSSCFEQTESTSLIHELMQLMSLDALVSDSSLVLGHMAFQAQGIEDLQVGGFLTETGNDVVGFWKNSRTLVSQTVIKSIQSVLENECGEEIECDFLVDSNCLIDFLVPARKLAILLSSPLQVIGKANPTGLALLRHRAAVSKLPTDWLVGNVSAVEWADADEQRRREIVHDLMELKPESNEVIIETSDVNEELREDLEDDDDDLSPYIQKDRVAAHRRRSPPDTSLPWVPSVFSLKRRKSSKRRIRNS
jgi:hypothetical protein